MLFDARVQAAERRRRADRIVDTGLGTNGCDEAVNTVRALRKD